MSSILPSNIKLKKLFIMIYIKTLIFFCYINFMFIRFIHTNYFKKEILNFMDYAHNEEFLYFKDTGLLFGLDFKRRLKIYRVPCHTRGHTVYHFLPDNFN